MRKRLLQLLLPLALLFSQQGAVWHELSHLARPGTAQAQLRADSTDEHAGDLCTLCLAYAHLAVGMEASPHRLDLLQAGHARVAAAQLASRVAPPLTARSRGPPRFF